MTLADLEKLFARIGRITAQMEEKAGPGTEWDYTFNDGSTTKYEITNVKTPEDLLDEFSHLALWVWSAKDYLKKLVAKEGVASAESIEKYVNSDPYLPMCADLANLLKHAELDTSRSGIWPTAVKPSYVITHSPAAPATPIKSVLFTPGGVRIDVGDPALVEIKFIVETKSGEKLPDGLEYLEGGIAAWEALLAKVGLE